MVGMGDGGLRMKGDCDGWGSRDYVANRTTTTSTLDLLNLRRNGYRDLVAGKVIMFITSR